MRSVLHRSYTSAFVFLFLLLSSWLVAAQQIPSLREINSTYGFDAVLRNLARSFADVPQDFTQSASSKFSEAWRRTAPIVFNAEEMTKDVEKAMEAKLSPEDRIFLLEFLKSPLGVKVTALEIEHADDIIDLDESAKLISELAASDPERLANYREIIDVLNTVDTGEVLTLNLLYAMGSGLLAEVGVDMSDADLMAAMRRNLGDVRGELEKMATAVSVATYRKLTAHELERYLSFLRSASSRRYYDAAFSGLDVTMTTRAKRFGHMLAKALRERKA